MHEPQSELNDRNGRSLLVDLRPAEDVAFALLDEQPTLFSESTQKLYALNEVAAFIWCSLAEGRSIEMIEDDLVHGGIDWTTATRRVADAVGSWLELGVLTVDSGSKAAAHHRFTAMVGNRRFSIGSTSPWRTRQLSTLFETAAISLDTAEDHILVAEYDGAMHIFFNGRQAASCPPDALLPTVKALITDQIVTQSRDIVFHAACMSLRGRSLLISGAPGAGKSTLSFHLATKGFGYATDDISLISDDGDAAGIPFAPTVKSGAWELVGRIRPELRDAAIHRRADGNLVKYVRSGTSRPGPHPIGWIVFIQRIPDRAVQLRPIGAAETMRRVIAASFSADGRLSLSGFNGLRRALARAGCFELSYGNASEAADLLHEACNDWIRS